ncbi:hypothetical protein Tco_0730332 [Tanacetum coccineum]|uniref:Reverse transcriptase Ty1/copia-type domain-containing protein n=1 Tax=Tanacetum coccineum TaxID=301880 RepID=A0ABQ4YSJ6_9ASTR
MDIFILTDKDAFLSSDKYVHEILRKFNYSDVKSASTPTDLEKPLVKDRDADDVDEHLYRSMIGSLMYLTASIPDIMFAVCACARFQVSPKTSHLLAVKRIFRYLKGKPSLGLWYSKDSLLELVAYTDSDYVGATLSRKSTTGGCQCLGNRLISWQCKKQTVVATSTTEAEYVAAASCCGQFYDKHNMVAFLEKSTGSAGFHQIIDFINRSHICYALTKKPEVCVSFIKQFWRSAEASTGDNGGVKINATIDGHSLSITEGSLRRHLKLADQDGITSILNLEIFEQLVLMGYHTDSDKLTFQKGVFSPQWRITSSPSHSPAPSTSHSPEPEPSTQHSPNNTTAAASQLSPTQPSPTLPSPGAEHHADLMKTKKTYSSAYTKLILRVKKLESHIKIRKARRQARVVLSDDEVFEDDSSKQGRKLSDAEVQEKASTDIELFIQEVTPTEVIHDQEGSGKASNEVSTAGAKKGTATEEVLIVSTIEVNLSTAGGTVTYTRRSAEKRSRQDKGKAIMIEEEPKKKSKKELEQERLSYAEAIRLEEPMNEEQRA